MKVPCPDCQHAIEIKSIKAGRFKLTCPKCQAAFGLQIEAGPPVKATRFRLQQAARSAEETKAPAADEATIAQDKPAQEKHSQPQPGKNAAAKASAGTHSSAAIATTRGLEETILPESNPRPVAHSTPPRWPATRLLSCLTEPLRHAAPRQVLPLRHTKPINRARQQTHKHRMQIPMPPS